MYFPGQFSQSYEDIIADEKHKTNPPEYKLEYKRGSGSLRYSDYLGKWILRMSNQNERTFKTLPSVKAYLTNYFLTKDNYKLIQVL